jgi:triacylglycerol lipase
MPFDAELARSTVALSRYVYRSEARAREGTEALGLTGFRFFAHAPNEALAANDDDHLYLAFRGTDSEVIDWVQNAEFSPIRGELSGRVHSGFHRGLGDLWPDIAPVVAAAAKPVIATGHSLGGALATLAAARLHESGHPVAGIYTYGQPRTGLRDFRDVYADRLDELTYRFINHIDLVTRVPLLVQGYRHVGQRVYFDAGGTPHVGAGAWRIAYEDLKFRLAHFGRIQAAGLSPHEISAYVDLIEGL